MASTSDQVSGKEYFWERYFIVYDTLNLSPLCRRLITRHVDLLAVDGLDGVFLGPSDLSVTLSGGERVAPADAFIDAPVRRIAERAKAAGKIAGAFAVNGERVRFYREIGYRLIALASEQAYLARGISAMLADVDAAR